MVGGEKSTFEDVMPLFKVNSFFYFHLVHGNQHQVHGCLRLRPTHQDGEPDSDRDQYGRFFLLYPIQIGVCEGLLYGYKAGLNLDEVIAAVGAGAAGSWSINNLGPRMIKRNFDPGFFVEHFIKDMGIALDEAKRMNLSLPGLALANQLYMSVKAQGNGKLGTQALMLALEKMNGLDEGISVQKKN